MNAPIPFPHSVAHKGGQPPNFLRKIVSSFMGRMSLGVFITSLAKWMVGN